MTTQEQPVDELSVRLAAMEDKIDRILAVTDKVEEQWNAFRARGVFGVFGGFGGSKR